MISLYTLVVNTPCAIILALSLNYVRKVKFKKFVQMVTYLPYFISTIVFVGILNAIFDARVGAIGSFFYEKMGTNILGTPQLFSSVYVYGAVCGRRSVTVQSFYIAALAGVDMEQHEAAIIDGATLLQRIRYVDLPAILPTAVIMLILEIGRILNMG